MTEIGFNVNKYMNPDIDIEKFWLGFKLSVKKYYNSKNNLTLTETIFFNDIDEISNKLNEFQSNNLYDKIELLIQDTIIKYCFYLVKYLAKFYYLNLANSNIKRWNKISKYPISVYENSNKHVFILFSIYHNYKKNDKNIIELESYLSELNYNFYNDYGKIIEISIKYDYSSIIDKIKIVFNIEKYVKNKYNIKINRCTSGSKILKKIKSISAN